MLAESGDDAGCYADAKARRNYAGTLTDHPRLQHPHRGAGPLRPQQPSPTPPTGGPDRPTGRLAPGGRGLGGAYFGDGLLSDGSGTVVVSAEVAGIAPAFDA